MRNLALLAPRNGHIEVFIHVAQLRRRQPAVLARVFDADGALVATYRGSGARLPHILAHSGRGVHVLVNPEIVCELERDAAPHAFVLCQGCVLVDGQEEPCPSETPTDT